MSKIQIISREAALLVARKPETVIQNLIKKINKRIREATDEELMADIFIRTGLFGRMKPEIKEVILSKLKEKGWTVSLREDVGPNPKEEIYIILKAPVK